MSRRYPDSDRDSTDGGHTLGSEGAMSTLAVRRVLDQRHSGRVILLPLRTKSDMQV